MTKYEQQYKLLCKECADCREDNACGVIALAVVADVDFGTALVAMSKYGRKLGNGVPMPLVIHVLKYEFGITMDWQVVSNGLSAKQALDRHIAYEDVGMVEVRGHVFTFKDGQAIDTSENLSLDCMCLFRIHR